MSSQKRHQRIAGMLVVVAIAVMLVPWLMREHHATQSIKGFDFQVPKQPNLQVEHANTVHVNMQAPVASHAWVVQAASFNALSNAQSLQNELQEQGYPAFTETITIPSGQRVFRVLVGPEVERVKLNVLLNELQQEFALRGLVVAYQPRSTTFNHFTTAIEDET